MPTKLHIKALHYPFRFGSVQAPTGLDADDEVRIVLNDFEHHDQQHLMQRYADTLRPGQRGTTD